MKPITSVTAQGVSQMSKEIICYDDDEEGGIIFGNEGDFDKSMEDNENECTLEAEDNNKTLAAGNDATDEMSENWTSTAAGGGGGGQ